MNKYKIDIRDTIGGLALIATGIFVAIYAQRYEIGELQRMGPGYFPFVLGLVLAALGVFIFMPALFREGSKINANWRNLSFILLSILVFSSLLDVLGLIVTVMLSVIVGSLPSGLRWRPRFVLSACIALITYLIFVLGLGMIIPVFPRIS